MLSSILSNSSPSVRRGMTHILSRINYESLEQGLYRANKYPTQTHTVILFEYVNSSIYETIAEMERIPETTYFIHHFLQNPEVDNALRGLFATKPNMKIYTRRKQDEEGVFTKYRQLILKIEPEMPSPILNPEELDSEIDSFFELNPGPTLR